MKRELKHLFWCLTITFLLSAFGLIVLQVVKTIAGMP